MTITTIRQRLIHYLEDAEDSKVKAIYTLLEKDIQEGSFTLTKEQLEILDKERALYLSNETKFYNKQEAINLIRGGKH